MSTVRLQLWIAAPRERCFDLCRSVDLHQRSAVGTGERAIGGVTQGLMGLGDEVIWTARHFGLRQRLHVRISAYDRPHSFADSQVRGAFARFDHQHRFEDRGGGTLMVDEFDFTCPLGWLGRLVDPIIAAHMREFLRQRGEVIRAVAESDEWRQVLGAADPRRGGPAGAEGSFG